MGNPSLKVEGIPEVTRAFDRVSSGVADMTDTHRAEAEMLLPEVSARTRHDTGNLAAAWEPTGEPDRANFLNAMEYAGVQEFGWSGHNIEPTLAVQNAFDSNESQTEKLYGDAIAKLGDKAGFEIRN
jgi:hypothetical protein